MSKIENYKECKTVEDLLTYIQKLPKETPLSRKNCDCTYNASTRFYYDNGGLLFGFEGNKVCIQGLTEAVKHILHDNRNNTDEKLLINSLEKAMKKIIIEYNKNNGVIIDEHE